MLARRLAVSVLVSVIAGACRGDPPAAGARVWECPVTAFCRVNLKVEVEDLVACYGTAESLPTELAGCATAMAGAEQWCLLTWEDLTFDAATAADEPRACCSWSRAEAEACCEGRTWVLTSTGGHNLEATVRQDCNDLSFVPNEDPGVAPVDCAGTVDLSTAESEPAAACPGP